MSNVTRWKFDIGGENEYHFERNPDRKGGDTGWHWGLRFAQIDFLGGSTPCIHTDGFSGAKRTLKFTAIRGRMMRTLQDFYLRRATICNCSDHLYEDDEDLFNCFIIDLITIPHPTIGNFPGSLEDTWDIEMTLVRLG